MSFKLTWRHPGETATVTESYKENTNDPEKWCRDILKFFNGGLRPGERPREFVRCDVDGEVPHEKHKWVKRTAMTQSNQYGTAYDAMICERCNVTGKRFGLGAHVKIDSKFKLKVYQRCDTSCAAQTKGMKDAAQ